MDSISLRRLTLGRDIGFGVYVNVCVRHGVNFMLFQIVLAAIFETSFSYDKDIWIAATDYALLHNYAISIDSYSPINKFYGFIFFSLLINTVILLLNCLVLVLYLYIHFLSLRCYFLYLNIIWAFV